MKRPLGARAAFAMLERFGPADEALYGDLLEDFRAGRSSWWLWRQVALAIVVSLPQTLRSRLRPSIEQAVLTAALIVLVSFCAVVAGNLVHRLAFPFDRWLPGPTEPTLVIAAASLVAAVIAGRVISHLHERHRVLAVVAFGATATLAVIARLSLVVPAADVEILIPSLPRQMAGAVLFVLGLLIGAMRCLPAEHADDLFGSGTQH